LGYRIEVVFLLSIIGCVLSLFRPYWGLLLVGFWYFFRPDLFGAEAWLRPVQWWTATTLIGWFLSARGNLDLRGVVPLLLIPAVMGITNLVAPFADAESTDRLLMLVKIFVFVFLVIKLCDTPRRMALFVVAMIAGCVWVSKAVLWNWAQVGFAADARIDVQASQGGGANYIAYTFVALLPFLLLGMARGTRWQKIGAAALIPIWVGVILATGSRGAFLALAAEVPILLAMNRRPGALLAVGGATAVFLGVAPQAFWNRIGTITIDPTQMDLSALARWQNFQAGLAIIRDHPVTGIGLLKFAHVAEPYLPVDYAGERGALVAHNTFLQIGTETGVFALAVFLGVTLFALVRLGRAAPRDLPGRETFEWVRQGAFTSICVGLVTGFFTDQAGMDFFWWNYGVAFAAILALDQYRRRMTPPLRSPANPRTPAPLAVATVQ